MKLSKYQVLDLLKVLSHYENLNIENKFDASDVKADLEDYLCSDCLCDSEDDCTDENIEEDE